MFSNESTIISPMTGMNLNAWPLPPPATKSLGCLGTLEIKKSASAVSQYQHTFVEKVKCDKAGKYFFRNCLNESVKLCGTVAMSLEIVLGGMGNPRP
jgi:hypothetical protein